MRTEQIQEGARRAERIIVLDAQGSQGTLALIEDGKVAEAMPITERTGPQIGDIYLGRTQQAHKGLEAAFVDIGLEKHAFLQLKDGQAVPRPGQEILAQVVKLPGGDKGVRVSGGVELAGALIALAPGGAGVGVSAKIKDEAERERLRAIGKAVCPPGCALVMRTAAAGQAEEMLAEACRTLHAEWEALERSARYARAPALLKPSLHPAERFVLDLLGAGCARIVVNEDSWQSRIAALLEKAGAQGAPDLERYRGDTPLSVLYPIQKAVDSARRRKVWLPGGGYLVFDVCEALTVVDVNAGKHPAKRSLEETALAVNLEAVRELAAQLRLRDIGGIVVIDTIDMRQEAHRQELLAALEQALAADRGKPRVFGGISALGLIQMTRKRLYAGSNGGQVKRKDEEDAEQ